MTKLRWDETQLLKVMRLMTSKDTFQEGQKLLEQMYVDFDDVGTIITRLEKKLQQGTKASEFLEEAAAKQTEQETGAEQRQAAAADTDLREACRQYYWPQWSAHDVLHDGSTRKNAIRTHLDILYALGQVARDMILKANGCWSQREFEGNRQSMAANGTNFVKGSLEADSTWKMNTIGDRPPYQYLEG